MMQSSDGRHVVVLDAVVLTQLLKQFWGLVFCKIYKLIPSITTLINQSADIKHVLCIKLLFAEII